MSALEQGLMELYNGNHSAAREFFLSIHGDNFSRALGLQASSLLEYIDEQAGLPALNKSISMGRAAEKLRTNIFDAHFMLAQAHAARYQRKGRPDDYKSARRHYNISLGLVHQRPDYSPETLNTRIAVLLHDLDACQAGSRKVEFTVRKEILDLHQQYPKAYFYDTSTHAPTARDFHFVSDASEFSPFQQYGNIPVPGMKAVSDSVEGVWQGLKVINGSIDRSYFMGKPRKRRGIPHGHLLGEELLGYIEARKRIFIPTYIFMIEQCVKQESLNLILERAKRGRHQFIFDVDSVSAAEDTSGPLAHSSVLVDYLNQNLSG